jgi:hypothetical protein
LAALPEDPVIPEVIEPFELVIQSNFENSTVIETLSPEFIWTFNDSVAQGMGFGNITLKNSSGTIQSFTVTLVENVLKIIPSVALNRNEVYTLNIPSDAIVRLFARSETETDTIPINEINLVVTTFLGISRNYENDEVITTLNPEFIWEFSGFVPSQGANFNLITLKDSLGNVINSSLTLAGQRLTIAPTSSLVYDESYTVFIPGGAVMENESTSVEEMGVIVKTYRIINLLRSNHANGDIVHIKPELKWYFDAEIIPGTAFGQISLLDNSGVQIAFDSTIEKNVLTISPKSALNCNSTYSVFIPENALTDANGDLLSEASLSFTTYSITERFFWTTAYTNALLTEFNDLYHYNGNFYNNVILNNFNETNVERWLRISADEGSGSIFLGGNYWGTINPFMIEKQILDFDDYQSLRNILQNEILTIAPSNTFPFVTDAFLINSNGDRSAVVGNETVTFVVEFNRDMNTLIPLDVKFGSSLPYAEYQITGSYVNPRRWEGTYTLKTTIENGNQYWNISGGAAADDAYLTLLADVKRFIFEIDTTSAQAMIMQGEATNEGINLSWYQDDFSTLAGYNVYRSTSQDGYYQRLNSVVIPSEVCTFFDGDVEPGVIYYYNFTVVQTDLNESVPSGKITIMSKDTMAPNVYHTPIYQAFSNSNLVVTASVVDNVGLQNVKLYYRITGNTEYSIINMTKNNDRYSAIISTTFVTLAGLEYYIEAFDGVSYTYKGTALSPYSVIIQLAVDGSSKGDVNGDGVITTLDALMLLQALNDRLNLTSEQFARADINSDTTLSAAEALRILQYVSGKITTILP